MPALNIRLLLSAVFLFAFISSCKKDKTPKQSCRIIKITTSDNRNYNITYNTEGKIKTIADGSDITSYEYSDNAITSTRTYNGNFGVRQIMTLNNDEMIVNSRTEHNSSGTTWTNLACEYNGTQLIKTTGTSNFTGVPSRTYSWSNGNLSTNIFPQGVETFEYYMDNTAQQGDYLGTTLLLEGHASGNSFIKNKNLLKSQVVKYITTNTTTTYNITYDFDSEGKIISAANVSSTGAALIYHYQYECK